jgi:hypothetical protein
MLSPEAWVALALIAYNTYRTERNGKETAKVHTLVNEHATVQDERIDQLAGKLQASGVTVPDRPKVGEG